AFNALFRQRAAVSLLRHHIAPQGSYGILTVSAIAIAFRLSTGRCPFFLFMDDMSVPPIPKPHFSAP
ncbi:MAG: hypothetical protein IKM82_04795, partial [Oscillospiraceae bacterium]|nr:hypothetical protein [Oscillospiraceae bacterium]